MKICSTGSLFLALILMRKRIIFSKRWMGLLDLMVSKAKEDVISFVSLTSFSMVLFKRTKRLWVSDGDKRPRPSDRFCVTLFDLCLKLVYPKNEKFSLSSHFSRAFHSGIESVVWPSMVVNCLLTVSNC